MAAALFSPRAYKSRKVLVLMSPSWKGPNLNLDCTTQSYSLCEVDRWGQANALDHGRCLRYSLCLPVNVQKRSSTYTKSDTRYSKKKKKKRQQLQAGLGERGFLVSESVAELEGGTPSVVGDLISPHLPPCPARRSSAHCHFQAAPFPPGPEPPLFSCQGLPWHPAD